MSKITMMAPRTIIQLEIWVPAIDVFPLSHSMTFILRLGRGWGILLRQLVERVVLVGSPPEAAVRVAGRPSSREAVSSQIWASRKRGARSSCVFASLAH